LISETTGQNLDISENIRKIIQNYQSGSFLDRLEQNGFLSYRSEKFDGKNLFPQNAIDNPGCRLKNYHCKGRPRTQNFKGKIKKTI